MTFEPAFHFAVDGDADVVDLDRAVARFLLATLRGGAEERKDASPYPGPTQSPSETPPDSRPI
jgi:hypothetical protein